MNLRAGGPNMLMCWVHVDDFLVTGRGEDVERLCAHLEGVLRVNREALLAKPCDHADFLRHRVIRTKEVFRIQLSDW